MNTVSTVSTVNTANDVNTANAANDTQALTRAAIQSALGPYASAVEVNVYDVVDSTNTLAKERAAEEAPALYIARSQRAGRGRLGRSFHSPADTGLYITVAYTTREPLTEAVRVTALAAVAAVSAIEALTDKHPAVKWVNDVYLGGCKIGGILTEAVTLPEGKTRMIVGIGVNLTTADFPEGLRAPASSLFAPNEADGIPPDFSGRLAGEISRRLLEALDGVIPPRQCLEIYRNHLLYVGEAVRCTRGSEVFDGTVLGVDEGYALLVEAEGETLALSSGEISIRPRT